MSVPIVGASAVYALYELLGHAGDSWHWGRGWRAERAEMQVSQTFFLKALLESTLDWSALQGERVKPERVSSLTAATWLLAVKDQVHSQQQSK